MTESSERDTAPTDTETDVAGDPTGPDHAGSRKDEATPSIGTEEQEPGQTQTPAPDDDQGAGE
jgi:hypothetical protein